MLQDLRFALRTLRRQPGFTAVAVAALALGIGANTAIFSIVNGVLLRPLPYPQPDRLVMIWQDLRLQNGPAREWASPPLFFDWRGEHDVFSGAAAVTGWGPSLTGGGREPERLAGAQVSQDYFGVLGVAPAIGRNFAPTDDRPGAPPVVVLSHALWRRLGGDPDIVGGTLTLSGVSHIVIGVLPADFRPAVEPGAEIFRPLRLDPASTARKLIFLKVVARLRPQVTLASAGAAMDGLADRLAAQYPSTDKGERFVLVPLHEQIAGPFRLALLVLMGAVVFVLLIACANVANLTLARASGRGREVAVRAALGAGTGRLVRQMLTEAVVLAAAGGAAGVFLAAWTVGAIVAGSPVTTAGFGAIGVDPRVLGFTALLTVATGLIFGLAPALHTARADLTTSLKVAARGAGAAGGRRLRSVLVAAEVAVALVLVVGAGLLLRSFVHLLNVDPGYRTDHVLTVPLGAPEARYTGRPEVAAFYDRVLERASALPGVRRAGLVSILPLSSGDNDANFVIEGRPEPTRDYDRPVAWYRMASAAYFEAMGIRLLRGRGITDADAAGAPGVVVVNQTFVRRYFPHEDPIGHRLQFGGGDNVRFFTIVGVAADILQRGLAAPPQVELYMPYRQLPERFMTLVLWTNGDPAALTPAVRGAVHTIDPLLPMSGVATMADLRARSVAQPRFLLDVLAAFAFAALLLAALGVYGVVSYGVAQRTGEIGIRIALGADRGRVLRLVMTDGLRLALVGVAVGVAGAFVATRALASLLFRLDATDPLTFTATAALLATVAALASFVPAWRATRVDPMRALRTE